MAVRPRAPVGTASEPQDLAGCAVGEVVRGSPYVCNTVLRNVSKD
jgi:hypothetical protein